MQTPPALDGPLARMFRAMIEKAEAENHHWDNLALYHFAATIAAHYHISADTVLDEICETPGHVLENARHPQGLTAVASYLASSLGAGDGPALIPTVH